MKSAVLVSWVVVVLVAIPAVGADSLVTVELAVADLSPSVPTDADWGWWTPAKYSDDWNPDTASSFGFVEARMLVEGSGYTVLLGGEWYPNLEATGSYGPAPTGDRVAQELTLKSAIYDLGLGMRLGRDRRNGTTPWIGVTYMDLSEELITTPADGTDAYAERATAGLWGVAAGIDGSLTVWRSIDVTGRLLLRWATGTRNAWIRPADPGGGGGEVKVSDSIDHFMWGLDLGFRWTATRSVALEIGWRLRDRTLDSGPARFGGPQLKAVIGF